jgi:peptide/nickel transport system substrate-binding protein
VMADANTRILRLEAGEIDIATDPPFNQLASLKTQSGIKIGLSPELGANTIWLNQKSDQPYFQDRLVRQAMNYAVDKDGIIKTAYSGYARPQISILPANELTDWSQKPYAYDPAKAKALLAKSKYPQGFKTTLVVAAGDPVAEAIATIAQANLGQIGITMAINLLELNTKTNLVYKYKYEMNLDVYTSDSVDPAILFEFGAVGHQFVDSYFTHYYNPQVNKLWNQSNLEFGAKRAATYKKMQQIVFADAPDIFLTYLDSTVAMRSNVHGFVINPTAHYFLNKVWKA